MKVLVLIEYDQQNICASNLRISAAAQLISDNIDALIIGENLKSLSNQVANLALYDQILVADSNQLTHQMPEVVAPIIVDLIKQNKYTHVLANTSSIGKSVMPRVAALLDVMQLSDIINVIDADTFVRTIYAGNAVLTVKSTDYVKIITVRNTQFEAITKNNNKQSKVTPVELASQLTGSDLSNYINRTDRIGVDLNTAKVIVSGGRGLGSKNNFERLMPELAKKLDAGIGASRAAVDAGFCNNDCQIGQTGKIVAPECYIAIGISGAIQHLTGIKDAKVIIAVNSDFNAPIFQVADYRLVADLNDVVPAILTDK